MGKYDPAAKSPRSPADPRPSCIANVEEVAAEAYERPKDSIAGVVRDVGEATGAVKLGVDVTDIPPGKKSSHLHAHSEKEEFFYVLSGRCRVRLGDGEYELRAGDALSRPAGTGVAHQFHNPYQENCRVLMLGVQAGQGVADTVDWPERGRLLVIDAAGNRRIERRAKAS